jgi:predicted hotdog family 3-hydroxylacyl-ACP dehydratase
MTSAWRPEDVLPHRGAMLLIDRIAQWDAKSLHAEAAVHSDNPLLESGLGLPCWALIEYMAQAAGALDGIRLREAGRVVPPGYLLGTRRLDGISGYLSAGTLLRVSVEEMLQDSSGLGAYNCRVESGQETWGCQLTVYRPPPDGSQSRV